MFKYRDNIPMLSNEIFFTDGGLETTIIFKKEIDLPYFAAFILLKNDEGRKILKEYFESYLDIAKKYQVNFTLESTTCRASTNWG